MKFDISLESLDVGHHQWRARFEHEKHDIQAEGITPFDALTNLFASTHLDLGPAVLLKPEGALV